MVTPWRAQQLVLVDAVVAACRGAVPQPLPSWPLADVQRVGLATGLTALAGRLGLFDAADDDVRAYVAEQQTEVAARAARFVDLTPRILAAFAAADVPVVPVKGVLLGGSAGDGAVWTHPDTRPMSDIDLLVEVLCEDSARLLAVIDDEIRSIPDVRSVESFTYFGIHTHRFVWGTR